MEWIEAKIEFDIKADVAAEELVADVFYAFGVKGVVVEDPETEVPVDALMEEDVRPPTNSVSGYFLAKTFDQARRQTFEQAIAELARRLVMNHRVLYRSLAEEDWAESWKAFFWPEKISERFVVKPTWRDYTPGPGEIIIDIDPGMAFGTGSHPSTALCLSLMERLLQPGDRFLDVGTGSGILMVAAAHLKAAVLNGVDNDPLAVEIARANLLRNAVAEERWQVWSGDLARKASGTYNFVAANIYAAVIVNLLDHLGRVMAPNCCFICSGITADQGDTVKKALEAARLRIIAVEECESWLAMAARNGG
jgi:ribosomal protein L11 methyltransferase